MNSVYTVIYRPSSVAYSACRSVFISVGLSDFYRLRLLLTTRLGIEKVSIAAVTNSAHVLHLEDPGVFHSKYRLRLERTQEHSSVKYSGCQIFHLGARLTFDSHRFNLCKRFSNLIKASNIM